ncbi:hypothetical protein BGY98DRAFT_940549 [Russula aff. rugulosa BPL654]|nr:hypothetical protein BGY98DRAFT_940549 [Russula aff. rugulosa BPL654]
MARQDCTPAAYHAGRGYMQPAIDDRQAVATERPVDAVPHSSAPVIDHMAEQAAIDDREGVATESIVDDDFDDDTAWMDVDRLTFQWTPLFRCERKICSMTCDGRSRMSTCSSVILAMSVLSTSQFVADRMNVHDLIVHYL